MPARNARTISTAGDPAHDVLVALRRIIRAVDLHSKSVSKASGLTPPQILILQAIRQLGEVTTGRVSAEVSLSQATVTTILDRLEQRDLIERYRSERDRRIVHARLSTCSRRSARCSAAAISTRLRSSMSRRRRQRAPEPHP